MKIYKKRHHFKIYTLHWNHPFLYNSSIRGQMEELLWQKQQQW